MKTEFEIEQLAQEELKNQLDLCNDFNRCCDWESGFVAGYMNAQTAMMNVLDTDKEPSVPE